MTQTELRQADTDRTMKIIDLTHTFTQDMPVLPGDGAA